jgi:dihydroorotate dehydrogenase
MSALPDLSIRIGTLTLKNPVIAGSGEHTMTAAGIRAALAAGAAAVVAKSGNESEAARRQLDGADYALLDSRWRALPWDFAPPPDAQLLCRSGLIQRDTADWLEEIAGLDREAAGRGAYVVPSLILAELETAASLAARAEAAGLRLLEFNIGAPHGDEAAPGAIVQERAAARVRAITARIRAATHLPLWIKLTGQSEDVAGLAVAAREGGADAVIMMGRFMAFLPDPETRAPVLGTNGALGGPWALPLTCRWLALARRRLGPDCPLIGTNGARDGMDVVRFLLAGASAVEMTSAVMAGGFGVIARAVEEIEDYLARTGGSAQDLVGVAADRLEGYGAQAARPGWWRNFVPPEARG